MHRSTDWKGLTRVAILNGLGLWAANFLFQAAGSVPEVNGCAFLSITLWAMLLVVPMVAAASVRLASQPSWDLRRLSVYRAAAFGAGLYSAVGFTVAWSRLDRSEAWMALLLSACMMVLSAWGASVALRKPGWVAASGGSAA